MCKLVCASRKVFFNISPKFTATFPVKNGFAVCFFALIEMNYYTVQKKKAFFHSKLDSAGISDSPAIGLQGEDNAPQLPS